MGGEGKTVETQELAGVESAVGLINDDGVGTNAAELETQGLGQQGEAKQRPQRRWGGG